MTKILVVSDLGVPTGYGRIASETYLRLARRGYDVLGFGLSYDGLLPASYDGTPYPFFVSAGGGKPNWVECVVNIMGVYQPDIVHVVQDAPYAEAVRNAPIDWSRYGFMVTTPVDGAPVFPNWVRMMAGADATLTISQFGVDTYRAAGVPVALCRPGVDGNTFFRLSDEARAALRAKVGIPSGAFVFGTAAMNQGRKAISAMLRGFFRFAQDKPDARYVLDMERTSPAGWDIPALCEQFGWDIRKLIFRDDLLRAGIVELRERYALMDAHAVLSHREGYGLPVAEGMACGVASMALDYCSGPELVGEGRGALIKTIDYTEPGTWGGAEDHFPDMDHFVSQLQWLHDRPAERAALAERGMAWSRLQTWDNAADAVQAAIERVIAKRKAIPPATVPLHAIQPPVGITPPAPVVASPDGVALVEVA